MADNNYIGERVTTGVFRMAFGNIFKPKGFDEGKPKYSLVMLFSKDQDISELENAAKKIAISYFNNKIPPKFNSPFKDGNEPNDEGNIHDGYPGNIAIKADSSSKPGIVDQNVQPILDQAEFKSGDYARATVTAAAYDFKGKKGVKFYLNNIQKVKDGEAFGAAVDPTKEFDAVGGGEDTNNMFGEEETQTATDNDSFL